MPGDGLVFREKLEIPEDATAAEMEEIILQNDDIQGATKASEESDEPKERPNALSNWELQNGRYGVELFGIKEVVGEFPYKMQFGAIDNWIKAEIAERGLEPSPKAYQRLLEELESETGTEDIDVYEKMKKLSEYIKVIKKYREIKKKKESFGL